MEHQNVMLHLARNIFSVEDLEKMCITDTKGIQGIMVVAIPDDAISVIYESGYVPHVSIEKKRREQDRTTYIIVKFL